MVELAAGPVMAQAPAAPAPGAPRRGGQLCADATFGESAAQVMIPPGADNPDLKAFHAAGHKMIVFHGNSDPVFSVVDTVNWYRKLDQNLDGSASDFVELYRIPGMPHGKPAGMPCVQLDDEYRCRLFGKPERPAFCASLRPAADLCGQSREEAFTLIEMLERQTLP